MGVEDDGLCWHATNPPDPAILRPSARCSGNAKTWLKGVLRDPGLHFFFNYPPAAEDPWSELQQGILSIISAVGHSGLSTMVGTQIIHFTGHACTSSNCRLAWPSQVVTPVQPSVIVLHVANARDGPG